MALESDPPLPSSPLLDQQVRVAKNTLLRRAIEGDEKWQVVSPKLEESNMWFFVGSDLKVCFHPFACVRVLSVLSVCVYVLRVCMGGRGAALPFTSDSRGRRRRPVTHTQRPVTHTHSPPSTPTTTGHL